MKKLLFAAVLSILQMLATAQSAGQKVVTTAEKVNEKSRQVSDASNKIAGQAAEVGSNMKNVAGNAKAVLKIFEPIFKLHFKKRIVNGNTNGSEAAVNPSSNNNTEVINEVPPLPAGNPTGATPATYDPGIPENTSYNNDGSANWGNQYNAVYGCFLDAMTGTVMDGGTAEEKPGSVDLIFLAPNDGQNTYYLVTPNFAHDGGADCFWGSCTTDNPVRSWKDVNESEVALTTLSGAQFDKIQYNSQLSGAVKSARGFAGYYSSPGTKLDGKVFAIKTQMENRTAYALVYVVQHIGTSGSKGALKVKIKCTGFDTNGDGNPDVRAYQGRN